MVSNIFQKREIIFMKIRLSYEKNMSFAGVNERNHITRFDTKQFLGGDDKQATPAEVMLEALAACSAMDVVSILRKRRKTISSFIIEVEGQRGDEHPKIFTEVRIKYILLSPDIEISEFNHAVELSQNKYCFASAMFKRAGCNVIWETELHK